MFLFYGDYLWENEMRENNIEIVVSSVRSLERGFDFNFVGKRDVGYF